MKPVRRPGGLLIGLLVLLLCAAGAALYGAYRVARAASFNLSGDRPVSLFVRPGEDWGTVSDRLARATKTRHPGDLRLLGRWGAAPRAGHYLVPPDETALALYRRVSRGAQTPVRLSFTTTRDIGRLWGHLADQLMTDSLSIARAMTDPLLLDSAGVADSTLAYHPIPNTYEVYWTDSARDIVRRLARESRAFWSERRRALADSLGMTPMEVTTLASILNEESAQSDEYPTIAGLYLNRLRIGMPLQSDPTVLFALGDRTIRRVRHKHLQADSPYNTYLHTGLPPGPIRIPSVAAIDAVLRPARHRYLYMCARADFSGYHDFAVTYAEHMRYARAYAAALDKRNIH